MATQVVITNEDQIRAEAALSRITGDDADATMLAELFATARESGAKVALAKADGRTSTLAFAPAAARGADQPRRTGRRPTSRRGRWEEAAAAARAAYDALNPLLDELESLFSTLRDIQTEYTDWRDNLPESLQNGELGSKLEAIGDIEIPDDVRECDIEQALSEIESADLPSGRNG